MQQLLDAGSHRSKNRLLVGCLSTLIGAPVMCCCLFGIFSIALPAIDKAEPGQFPTLLVLGGLAVFGLLALAALGGMFIYLRGRKFPGLSAPDGEEDPRAKVARIRKISLIALVVVMPLCFIAIAVAIVLIIQFIA